MRKFCNPNWMNEWPWSFCVAILLYCNCSGLCWLSLPSLVQVWGLNGADLEPEWEQHQQLHAACTEALHTGGRPGCPQQQRRHIIRLECESEVYTHTSLLHVPPLTNPITLFPHLCTLLLFWILLLGATSNCFYVSKLWCFLITPIFFRCNTVLFYCRLVILARESFIEQNHVLNNMYSLSFHLT